MYVKKGWKCCDDFDINNLKIVECNKARHKCYKKVCASCGHFIKLCANPDIDQQITKRNENIETVILHKDIKEKEKIFLHSVKNIRFMTPRQFTYFNMIILKYKD
jgi:hypothetical protein